MKATLLAALSLVFTLPAVRAEEQQIPLITTTGTAEVKVVPDLADLSFEVEVRHAELLTARKAQSERTTKVLAALREAGVAEADLQTSQISVTPNYAEQVAPSGRSIETTRVQFYSVSQQISVTLHEVKKVPDVIATGLSAGATGLQGASLRTSELRKHRDTARANAVKAAKEKADALAKELGVKAGRPFTITEASADFVPLAGNNFNRAVQMSADAGGGNGEGASFAAGVIPISATVTVAFRLE
jgi:uncharacterized protein YggE